MNSIVNPEAGRSARPVDLAALDAVHDALCGVLADGVDIHRCLAAKALGRIGVSTAVRPLVAALLDEDEDVRTDAAEALDALADPGAGQQLFENLLGDPCMEVKLAAIRTLAKLQDRQIIPWLRRMVLGRDEEIAWDDQEFFESGWDDWMEIQMAAITALGELKVADAVPDIIEAIRDENAQDMTETAFRALAAMGDPGIEALSGFLDQNEPVRLRRRAAAVLGGIATADGAAHVARAFSDPSPEVRAAALRARAAVAPDDAGLEGLLGDPYAAIRAEAVSLVGRHHPDRLVAMLDDPSGAVQTAVLGALDGIGDSSRDSALIGSLQAKVASPHPKVRAAAANRLATLAPQEALQLLVPLLADSGGPADDRLAALRALASIGDAEAVAALVAAIDDSARAIRIGAMSSLALLARRGAEWPNAAGEALLAALRGRHDPEPAEADETRPVAAAQELPEEPVTAAVSDDPEAFPTSTLKSILEDTPDLEKVAGLPATGIELSPDDMERLAIARQVVGKKRVAVVPTVVVHEDIRRFAARVLGDLDQPDVAEALAEALSSPDGEVRSAAADSLARISSRTVALPPSVVAALLAALETDDRDQKLMVIRALAAAECEEVGEALKLRLADPDSFVRTEAVRSLLRLGRVGPEVEALLGDPEASTRLAAAEAVAGSNRPDAVDRLVEFSCSHEGLHRRETARLLRDLDATAASAAYLGVLQDPGRKRLWAVAIEALEELSRS